MANNKKMIEDQIKAHLEGMIRYGEKNIRVSEIEGIGKRVIRMIMDRVNVGISPIRGNGRFPAYKAAAVKNEINREARKIEDPKRRRAFKKSLEKAANKASKGYPFSVQGKYPNKQVRPVNLRLSGKFLLSLLSIGKILPNKFILELGFEDPDSVNKERGHREGANTQPERPIIPQGEERFTPEIEAFMFQSFKEVILRAFARFKGRT